MTEKEVSEIRRRFRAEKSNITRIRGCYVNEKKEIISQESDAGKGTFRLRVPSEYHPMRELSFQE